jgi:hypothetical protein
MERLVVSEMAFSKRISGNAPDFLSTTYILLLLSFLNPTFVGFAGSLKSVEFVSICKDFRGGFGLPAP